MEADAQRVTLPAPPTETALVVSEVRFLCESVAEIVTRLPRVASCNLARTIEDALALIAKSPPAIVLIDVALPQGKQVATYVRRTYTAINVIALGVQEADDDVFAWLEAGVAGYVPNTSSVKEMLIVIDQIRCGEQQCSAKIAGALLRRFAGSSRHPQSAASADSLTRREQEVLNLVNTGLSNKDIARRLHISLSTAKTHVHHLLGKLKATSRSTIIAASNTQAMRHSDANPL